MWGLVKERECREKTLGRGRNAALLRAFIVLPLHMVVSLHNRNK